MLVSIPMSVKYGNSVGYALRNGSSLLIMRLKVNSTSSALNSRVGLKYGVVWNSDAFTQVEGVGQAVIGDVPLGRQPRNYGAPPRSNWVKRLNMVSAEASKSVPVVY